MNVHVHNFQSNADTTLDVEGLTVVVGPSNAGKSSLIRAINAALFNRSAGHFVREGEDQASVELAGVPNVGGGSLDIAWSKGKRPAVYQVDGERFEKVGKTTPDLVRDAGFRDIELRDVTLRPQVAGQSDPKGLFLLHEPGSTLVDALAAASRLDIYSVAVELCGADLRAAQVDARVACKRDDAVRTAVEGVKPLAEAWLTVRPLVDRAEVCEVNRVRMADARRRARVRDLVRQTPCVTDIGGPMKTTLPGKVAALRRLRAASRILAVLPLAAPVHSRVRELSAAVFAWRSVGSIPALSRLPASPTATAVRARIKATKTVYFARKIPVAVGLRAAPELGGLGQLIPALGEYRRSTDAEISRQATVMLAKDDATHIESLRAEFLEAHPTCPACGQLVTG